MNFQSWMKRNICLYLDHHHGHLLLLQFVLHKRKRKLLIEVVHDLGTNTFFCIFPNELFLISVHHHIKDIDIKRINDITTAIHPIIIEKKRKNIDHVLHHVTKSKFHLKTQNLLTSSFFQSFFYHHSIK